MAKGKQDPSKFGLGSSHVQGQGTTTEETGIPASSARKKQKRS